ncbi:MAG: ATP synthase F1 subunit epsilon [Candidatus Marinimicrobia bacterium]|nr:ATP synthase F1 subunit epsilon [Candidatus Neomarinimicrobiota bacterium]|tara:strand:- start:1428 stop:1829 length:402 start_codon:yes stop_codon:yes gene_type:complete
MNKKFHLDIVTPNGTFSIGKINYLRAPSIDGLFGVLANHIPSIIAIGAGEIKITVEGKDEFYATSGGYADINKESVSLVLETAENANNIDIKRSEEAVKRAAKHLDNPSEDLNRARKAIERAKVRISVAKRFN